MATTNHHTREINFKIVYYGAGLCGKTTSLQYLHQALRPEPRGPLVMLPTSTDRTLYFDFLPLKLPKLGGYTTRIHLYTVPGQVHYNATRKLVLTGADGIVFIVDSQRSRMAANTESLQNLRENLDEQQRSLDQVPWVIQYNQRDQPELGPLPELEAEINKAGVQGFETIATRGDGVYDALKAIVRLVLTSYRNQEMGPKGKPGRPLSQETSSVRAAARSLQEGLRAASHGETVKTPAGSVARAATQFEENFRSSFEAAIEQSPEVQAARRAKTRPSTEGSLSQLVSRDAARLAITEVETQLQTGDSASAVQLALRNLRTMAREVAGALTTESGMNTLAMSAFLLGLPPSRFLHLRELEERAGGGGGITSADALFALFILADFALRLEEQQLEPPRADASSGARA